MHSDHERRLLDAIDETEIRDLLVELVRRPSPNPPGGEDETARYLAEACRSLGLSAELHEVADGRPNVYARVGPEHGKGLILLGHTDTVPAGDGFVTRGDRRSGRGAGSRNCIGGQGRA